VGKFTGDSTFNATSGTHCIKFIVCTTSTVQLYMNCPRKVLTPNLRFIGWLDQDEEYQMLKKSRRDILCAKLLLKPDCHLDLIKLERNAKSIVPDP
jgi:hypothetical protein